MNYNQKESIYFCRFTFGQFFALLILEILTLFFVFYLGSKFGTDFLGGSATRGSATLLNEEGPKVSVANPRAVATTQDPAIQKLASDLVHSSTTPELKNRVAEILDRDTKGATAPAKKRGEAEVISEETSTENLKGSKTPQTPQAPFSVQVGSYPNLAEAGQNVALWKKRGYPSFMMIADIPDKGRWYRVRLGSFETKEEAQNFSAQLKNSEAVDAIVVSNR